MEKIIGITGSMTAEEPPRQQVGMHYLKAVQAAGALPVVLYQNTAAETLARHLDGLLLSGGGDIHPRHFNQPLTYSKEIDEGRDAFELALCKEMVALGKPVFGICRGVSIMGITSGMKFLCRRTALCCPS